MIGIALADIYYKIEDKWFDLLDWLEAHGLPVYKIVDPLEKRGIPSLPVFVALSLILLYVIFGMLLAGGGPQVCFVDDKGNPVSAANVSIYNEDDEVVFSGTTGDNGCVSVALGDGSYEATLDKSGYDSNKHDFDISDGKSDKVTVRKQQGALSKTLCFSPRDAGDVTVTVRNSAGVYQDDFECAATCKLSVQLGMYYTFTTSTHSSDTFSYDDLKNKSATSCIALSEEQQATEEKGRFTVQVVDAKSNNLKDIRVHLVNPDDDATDVVSSSLTDAQGKTTFTGDIGDDFKIYIPAPANTNFRSFLDTEKFAFSATDGFKRITLYNGTASIVFTVVDPQPVPGAYVSLFLDAERFRSSGTTNSSGQIRFSVDAGKEYRATFTKDGYDYVQQYVRAGNDYTITLTRTAEAKLGSIDVTVVRSDNRDEPISDVTLTLYNITSDGSPLEMGIPNPKPITLGDGKGYMNGIPIGTYCVIATRGSGGNPNTCDEGKVTVTAGKRSNITIALKPIGYTLTVTVITVGGTPADYASVTLKEYPGKKTITTKNTNTNGIATFSVIEEQKVYIYVTYAPPGGETFVSEQIAGPFKNDERVTVQLAHLDTTLRLIGIFKTADLQADSLIMPPKLGSGAEYYFGFQLGLPNVTGINRWDKIEAEFEIASSKIAMFKENLYYSFPVKGDDIVITNDGGLAASKKITIAGAYDPAGVTVTFAVPFEVKSDFGGDENNTIISYKCKWTSTAYNQVKNDPLEIYPFNVSKSAISQPPSRVQGLNFTLALAIANETGSYRPENYSAVIGTLFNLTASITSTGDKNYSGVIRVLSIYDTVNFTWGDAPGNTFRVSSNGREANITILDNTPLQPGQTMSFMIKGKAINSGRAYIPINITYQGLQALENPLPNFNPYVYDSRSAGIVITKPGTGQINDFTTSMHFSIKDRGGNTIDQLQVKSVVLSGTAIMNGECRYDAGSNPGQAIKADPMGPPSKANFTVDFISDCPLAGGGDIQISVVTQTQDYTVDPLSMTVTQCLGDITTRTKTIKSGETDDISDRFTVNMNSTCADTKIGIKEATIGFGGCDRPACTLDDRSTEIGDGDHIEDLTHLSGSRIYVSTIDFWYQETTGSNYYVDISLAMTLNSSEKWGREINRQISIPVYITVTPTTGPGPGPDEDGEPSDKYFANYFKPLPIQKYTNSPTSYDCANKYCTLEQLLQKIENCADPSVTCTDSYNFKMVDEGWVIDQVVELAKMVYPSFSSKIVSVLPGSPSGYLLIEGTASAGDNTVKIEKIGSAASAYKTLTFAHTTDAPSDVKSVQLYMPVVASDLDSSGKQLFGTSYSTKGLFDPTKTEVLDLFNTSIITQWALDSYPKTWGTAIYDHHMNASVDGDIDRPSIFLNGNRIEFVGKSENSLKRLLNSFIAYMDPDDSIMVDAMHEFLVLDNGVIKTGPLFFTINTSDVSIGGTTYDSLRTKIRERIRLQLANEGIDVDQTYLSSMTLVDGIMGDSYMVVAIANRNKNEHIAKFQSKFGSTFQPPDKGILWGDSLRHYVYAPDTTVAGSLLDVLMGTATAGYEKIGLSPVVQYETKAMSQINDTIASKKTSLTTGQNYSTIWKTTPCGLNLTSIQALGVKIFLDGVEVTTVNGAFKDGAIYLVNMANETSQFTVYAKTLKSSTTACGTTAPPDCGNGACGTGETCSNCPADCACPAVCGNGVKETSEECDGSALGSCTACTSYCTCRRGLDLVFLGDDSGDKTVNLYNYSAQADLSTISDNTKNSKTRTRLDIPDFAEDKLKIADIDGDGKSEIIVFDNDGTDKKLSVLKKSNGAINLTAGYLDWRTNIEKSFTFKSLKYTDFAVFYIGSDPALAMLEKDGSKNDVWVYKYSSIANGASIDSNYNSNNKITQLDINDKSFTNLKAVTIDSSTKLLAFESESGGGADHQTWVGIYAVEGTVSFGAGYKNWNDQHTQFFQFKSGDSCSLADGCRDIDLIDWDNDGSTELACLNEDPIALTNNAENNILLYTVSSLKNTGGDIDLCNKETYRSNIDTDNTQAEKLYIADINGDGKLEMIQADLTGDSSDSLRIYGNKIDSSIGEDPDDEQLKVKTIYMTGMPYIDMAVYDWSYDRGTRVA